ncbi:hypothetical protein D3C76_1801940 [compost metagenome]
MLTAAVRHLRKQRQRLAFELAAKPAPGINAQQLLPVQLPCDAPAVAGAFKVVVVQ